MPSDSLVFDLHVHTKYSPDSRLEPLEILRKCAERKLDGVAITDHGTIKGGLETVKMSRDYGVKVIVGAEIMTDFGEIIGYHLNEEIKSRRVEEVIDEIKSQGGYVCVPHPFDSIRKSAIQRGKLFEVAKKLDFVEGLNARCFWFMNKKAMNFARERNIPVTAGSDVHMGFEVGRCITRLHDAGRMVVDSVESRSSVFYPIYPLARTKFYKVFRR